MYETCEIRIDKVAYSNFFCLAFYLECEWIKGKISLIAPGAMIFVFAIALMFIRTCFSCYEALAKSSNISAMRVTKDGLVTSTRESLAAVRFIS